MRMRRLRLRLLRKPCAMSKYNAHDNDRYLLENNLLGIRSLEDLKEAEAFVFALRAAEIDPDYRMTSFTERNFKQLHYHLFKDIYAFAGKYRDVQLTKGNTRFCQAQFIKEYAKQLFVEFNEEPAWESVETAAARLAYFKSELNMLHPFREGNGRTIRMYLRAYALSKGVDWQFEQMDRDTYIHAMIASVTDNEALTQVIRRTIYQE